MVRVRCTSLLARRRVGSDRGRDVEIMAEMMELVVRWVEVPAGTMGGSVGGGNVGCGGDGGDGEDGGYGDERH